MVGSFSMGKLIAADKLPGLREELDRLEAQRKCMRIPDRYWFVMLSRARKSQRPLLEALQSELNRYAKSLQQFLRGES